jgi:cytochrome c peroxidase
MGFSEAEQEIDDLIAFMASLTSPQYKEQGAKELARQREVSRTSRPQRDTARAFGSETGPARAAPSSTKKNPAPIRTGWR